jgi:hypothetical protein
LRSELIGARSIEPSMMFVVAILAFILLLFSL